MTDSFLQLLPPSQHAAFHESLKQHPRRSIRVRPEFDSHRLRFETETVPWYRHGRFLMSPNVRPSQFIEYGAGCYYIQDAGSLLALALLDAQPGELICDLCAAPGGKASGILEQLDANGFLVANEAIHNRIDLLRFTLARSGYLNYAITQLDPERLAEKFPRAFDAVLVDAPCSGQSMVASGKRDRNAFDSHQIEHSARRQERILRAATKMLKSGGRLIYSTCTFAIDENEMQIEGLLERSPNSWEAIQPPGLESWSSPRRAGCYRLWPHLDATSGAFAAGLRMRERPATDDTDLEVHSSSNRQSRDRSKARRIAHQNNTPSLDSFGSTSNIFIAIDDQENIFGIDTQAVASLREMVPHASWPILARQKGDVVVPQYALSMLRPTWFRPHAKLEVDSDAAKAYLSGNILLTGEGCESSRNWVVVAWQGYGLGWAKVAGARINNHLPKLGLHNFASGEKTF